MTNPEKKRGAQPETSKACSKENYNVDAAIDLIDSWH